jgi:HK97 family phage major capsid protein
MAKSAKQLMEERAPLGKKIQEMAELLQTEKRDFTSEEQANWDQLNKDYDLLTRHIDTASSAERIANVPAETAELNSVIGRGDVAHRPGEIPGEHYVETRGPTSEDYVTALQAWCRRGMRMELESRHILACQKIGQSADSLDFIVPLSRDYNRFRREYNREQRVQIGVTDTAGGFLRPDDFVRNLERALLAFGGVRAVADVMRTDSGNDMPWPTTNDTSNKGQLIGESTPTTAPEQDVTFGQTILRAHLYSSKVIRVSRSLLQDAAFPLGTVISDMLGERIGRITSEHYTTGSGGSLPQGVVTASTAGKTTAVATAISFDEIIDLVHSIDPAYRSQSSFMMHDLIMAYVRKIKDGESRFIWQQSTQVGEPDRLLGYPVTINQDMQSTVATATRTMLFGDFSKYKIRDVGNIRFTMLDQRWGELDQVGFVAFFRTDGALLNAGTAPVKHMLQA